MKDYSQNGEQKIILDYFGEFRGTFLDCGANDGVTLSNTHALARRGWRGVLVEPSPAAFENLVKEYSVATQKWNEDAYVLTAIDGFNQWKWLVQAAITTQDGPITLHDSGTHLKKGDTSLLSTTRPEEMARWKKSGETFTEVEVRGITIATLLRETGQTSFDFISIDCEGVDLEVLRQLDLTALGTRMVCVETNSVNDQAYIQYCASHGMRLKHKNFENCIFAK